MAITVTIPSEAPTGISTTLVTGGTLTSGVTYYYVMFSTPNLYTSPSGASTTRFGAHSPISEEGNFTTTETERSVKFNWTNATGATNYEILLSTTSGSYAGTQTYSNSVETMDSNITDGVAGHTITAPATGPYVRHSVQLYNEFVGGVTKDGGTVKVYLDGTLTYDIEDVYDAVVAAGYSAYTFYDGYNFVLKGVIMVDSSSSTGSLVVEQKSLVFIKGGVHNSSSTFTTRFGRWTSDIIGANYTSNIFNFKHLAPFVND